MERTCTDEDIATAMTQPPQTTRARLRGAFVRRAKERRRDFTVDWVHLKLNDQAQRTVLLKDPFKSHDERVERLIASLDDGELPGPSVDSGGAVAEPGQAPDRRRSGDDPARARQAAPGGPPVRRTGWRALRELQQRVETELRESLPDLPPTSEIARMARSPLSLVEPAGRSASSRLRAGACPTPGPAPTARVSPGTKGVQLPWPVDRAAERSLTAPHLGSPDASKSRPTRA